MTDKEKKREDARIIKTRGKLFGAFTSLLSEKPFEEITINEICDTAGVRRATFYKHFRDKYDFLAVLVEHFIDDFKTTSGPIDKSNSGADYHVAFARELIHYLLDNEDAVKLLIKSNMRTTLIDIVVKQIYTKSYDWLVISTNCGATLVADTETVATMLAGGVATVIIKWFASDRTTSPSELTAEIEKIIRAMFVS